MNEVMSLTPAIESKLQDSDQRKMRRTSHTGEEKQSRHHYSFEQNLLVVLLFKPKANNSYVKV